MLFSLIHMVHRVVITLMDVEAHLVDIKLTTAVH